MLFSLLVIIGNETRTSPETIRYTLHVIRVVYDMKYHIIPVNDNSYRTVYHQNEGMQIFTIKFIIIQCSLFSSFMTKSLSKFLYIMS
jgi:mRNA-degrading endonuclease HigB of HigAB toxin-antitoxin module